MTVAGTYINVANGYIHLFEPLGWEHLKHVYEGTHHAANGAMLQWKGEGEPAYPDGWKTVSETEELTAKVVAITGDREDDRYITLGIGDGTFQRWRLTDSLLKKIRREINDRLD